MSKRDDDLEFSVNAAFDEDRTVVDKTALYLVNGSLGAGKTSVLEFLLQQDEYRGSRVIENEYANENVDGYRLERLTNMVATLSGDCVCCSSKHALTRMLIDFYRADPAPVFLEATGVARTMNLVEKLINAQTFRMYNLMQSFYVIDAKEILGGIQKEHETELQAADIILITKEDLLTESEKAKYDTIRNQLPYSNIVSAPHGRFDLEKITTPSSLLDFFDAYDGELAVPDNPTYSVIDTSDISISAQTIDTIWSELFATYGLRRMKGCFCDGDGRRHHVEATSNQIVTTNASSGEREKIVFIGDRADQITRESLQTQLVMFE